MVATGNVTTTTVALVNENANAFPTKSASSTLKLLFAIRWDKMTEARNMCEPLTVAIDRAKNSLLVVIPVVTTSEPPVCDTAMPAPVAPI